jgi:hypothetical protein
MTTNNNKKLESYIETMNGSKPSGKVEKLKHPEIRKCKICGEKYAINYPYEHCNRETRDLCDDCIYPEWPKTLKM